MSIKANLLELNRRGLIPAPGESDARFFQRCEKANTCFASVALAKDLFDINPDWVELSYDNKGLRLWEGACTWIGDDKTTIQLKKAFKKKSSHMGYSRDEVITHELVHVVRSAFQEPIFEEIIAYQSSSSFFRRFCAPVFRSTKESFFLVGSLFILLVTSFFETANHFALAIFLMILSGGIIRLLIAQKIFATTKKKLSQFIENTKVLAVMLRLTDKEIISFAKMGTDEIKAYAQKMSKSHIRWQQITSAYFEN